MVGIERAEEDPVLPLAIDLSPMPDPNDEDHESLVAYLV
jgi:hypothetical protein